MYFYVTKQLSGKHNNGSIPILFIHKAFSNKIAKPNTKPFKNQRYNTNKYHNI